MSNFGIYSLQTGFIRSTNSVMPDVAGLKALGFGAIAVPDGATGLSHRVDITQSPAVVVELPPPPPQIPSLQVQNIAAQINAGILPVSAFHPETIADMNTELAAVDLPIIKT